MESEPLRPNAKYTAKYHPIDIAVREVPEEEWRNLHATLEQIIDLITRRNADDSSSEWIESETARKLLGISPRRGRITATNASSPSRR